MSWGKWALEVLTYEQCQDRDLWLAMRRQGLGGSDGRVLMGHGYADESEFTVLRSKQLVLPEREDNIRFRRGNHMESFVASEFARREGLTIAPARTGMWWSKPYPWLYANPDWVIEIDGEWYILETKHVDHYGNAKAYRMLEQPPPRFYWQGIPYLACTMAPGLWIAVDSPHYSEIKAWFLDRDLVMADIDRWLDRSESWWTSHVVNGFELVGDSAPVAAVEPVEGKTVEATIPELVTEAYDRLELLKYPGTTAGKAEIKQITDMVEVQMGDAQILAVEGVPMFRRQSRKNPGGPDWDALEAVLPGAKKKYMKQGTTSHFIARITPTKGDE